MKLRELQKALTYDDVTLKPQYSDIKSRAEVSLATKLKNIKGGQYLYRTPIISAPMDTVTESSMCNALADFGALGIVHRYNTIDEQVAICKKVCIGNRFHWGAAIGVKGDYLERAAALMEIDEDSNIICIDVAHGHHQLVKEAVEQLRGIYGNEVHIMAGNIATSDAYTDLAEWGVDSLRVGIGAGATCSTRLKTGHGVPNVSAISACYEQKLYRQGYGLTSPTIIADGGIRKAGDVVKAIAFGADFVMCGSLLAGTDETPNDIIEVNGNKFKSYRGMASEEAQQGWRGFATAPEGVSTTVPAKGSIHAVMSELIGNIKSGFSYSGARNIEELRENASALLQTSASIEESTTHILK